MALILILSIVITYSFNYSYGEITGDYGYVNASTGLNVRSGPGISYAIKDNLDNNAKVTIYEERFTSSTSSIKSNVWIAIDSDKTRFIRSDFVDGINYDTIKATTTASLNYRAGAGLEMRRVGTFSKGQSIDIVCNAKAKNGYLWYKVKVGSSYYYVSSKYVSLNQNNGENSVITETTNDSLAFNTAYVDSTFGLNVRKGPGTGYSKVGRLENNEKINVYSEKFVSSTNYSDKYIWLDISGYNNKYVRSDYVDNYKYTETKGTVKDKLNYRMGAGLSMKYAGTFSKAASITVVGKAYDSKGNLWYKVKVGTKYYYAYGKYITLSSGTSDSGDEDDESEGNDTIVSNDVLISKAKVNSTYGLNIRKGPGVSYATAGVLGNNDDILIYEEKFITSSYYGKKYIWLSLDNNNTKYVRADYVDNVIYKTIYGKTTSSLNYRKGAGTNMPLVGTFKSGESLNIVAKARNKANQLWYKVKVGSSYYYVSAEYVKLTGTSTGDSDVSVPSKPNMTNEEFEAFIEEQGFPESYKVELRKLHVENPSWVFYAQQIDIPFDTVVDKEAKTGKYSPSLIHSIYPESYKSVADGDYIFGKYAVTQIKGSTNSVFIYNNGEVDINSETYTSSTSTSEGYIWLEITFNGKRGFVKASEIYGESYQSVKATANHSTNIRAGAGTSMTILGKYEAGDTVDVVMKATDSNGLSWYKIKYNGDYAYVYAPNFDLQNSIKSGIGRLTNKGEYIPHDATCWFTADRSAVAYYMDPRNFLNSDDIYMFEDLSFHEDYQTVDLVDRIISGTQLEKNGFKASWFVEAGKTYEVSPVHLAARAKVETGGGTGYAISGVTFTYGSSTYSGIYNPYNIGATSGTNPVVKGLYWAATGTTYQRPWNDKKKSVMGGAQFIASGYINNNQNSIYTQKFNVANGLSNVATHQYMTNITAPLQEAAAVKKQYEGLGITDEQLTFIIPVYKDMPMEAIVKPSSTGNNNYYLSSLKVTGYDFTGSFDKDVTVYTVSETLPVDVSSIDVKAFANSKDAIITGNGSNNLESGKNIITIKVTSSSGKVKTYKIVVYRD